MLTGANLDEEVVAIMASQLHDLTRDELDKATYLLARDEELVRAIRFGGTLMLADFYRVLRLSGEEPTAKYMTAEEAPEWAKEDIKNGTLRLRRGQKIKV